MILLKQYSTTQPGVVPKLVATFRSPMASFIRLVVTWCWARNQKTCTWSIERRHLQWPGTILTPVSRSRHSLTLNISETVRDRHSFNRILLWTYTRPNQQCHFKWLWVTLSDLAKYSMTRSVAQSRAVSLRQLSFL